jgi:hypothetical protein
MMLDAQCRRPTRWPVRAEIAGEILHRAPNQAQQMWTTAALTMSPAADTETPR